MSTVTSEGTLFVVFDATDRVVLICGGADAPAVAAQWKERGYRVVTVDGVTISAA